MPEPTRHQRHLARAVTGHDLSQRNTMIFNLRQPLSFTEIGRKDNQEDFLWPTAAEANAKKRVFILCDGVGGHERGEVASQTAATALGQYLTRHWPLDGVVTKAHFEAALDHAYDELDKADLHPESGRQKMGTTMTCLVIHRGGTLLAHIGDSRIYHLRPAIANPQQGRSGIIYQTVDHSLVNDLLRAGEITEEEAADFPHKNVITRAMQPHIERRYKADVYNLTDVRAGDYFFLCSDGVLEQLTSETLGLIVANTALGDAEKMAAIKSLCFENTRDNYSCWLIPIDGVTPEEGDHEATMHEILMNTDSELADDDYEEDAGAEENIEQTPSTDMAETEEMEEAPKTGFLTKTKAALARCLAFLAPAWQGLVRFIKGNPLSQRLKATNRWQWIAGVIIFLAAYDTLLYFVGDTTYSIIFPTPTPSDSILNDDTPVKPLIDEIEEYEAPKPSIEKADDLKKIDEENEKAAKAEKDAEEAVPTTINSEAISTEENDAPSINDIKDAKVKIEISKPVASPTE